MAQETFIMRMEMVGAGKAAQGIRDVGDSSQKTIRILQTLRNLLVGLAFLRAAAHAVEFMDSMKQVQNSLTQVTSNTKELAEAQKFLTDQTKANRTSLTESAKLYVGLSRALKPLGVAEDDVRLTTDLLTKSIKLSGKTMTESKELLERFVAEMANGSVSGEIMKNTLEKIPRFAQSIAQHFNIATGEVEAFVRNNPGLITTSAVIQALKNDAAQLEAEFSRLKSTLSEAITVFLDRLKEYVATAPVAIGATNGITGAIIGLANNMNIVMGVVAALTVMIAGRLAAEAIPLAITGIQNFGKALTTSSIGAWTLALSVAIGVAIAFSEPLAASS
jgi:tape measure domain-containing protein